MQTSAIKAAVSSDDGQFLIIHMSAIKEVAQPARRASDIWESVHIQVLRHAPKSDGRELGRRRR